GMSWRKSPGGLRRGFHKALRNNFLFLWTSGRDLLNFGVFNRERNLRQSLRYCLILMPIKEGLFLSFRPMRWSLASIMTGSPTLTPVIGMRHLSTGQRYKILILPLVISNLYGKNRDLHTCMMSFAMITIRDQIMRNGF